MKTLLTLVPLAAALCIPSFSAAETTASPALPPAPRTPRVQIALLLDTSGSMSGLIEQTKGQLWKVVNEFISARQDGIAPEVQVALYEYGKTSLNQDQGWVRRIQPLTTDLDRLSEDLFALETNGGDEYCGWVIRQATRDLQWSDHPGDFKAIFVAGNEPFTQGPVDYRAACKEAIERGIIVNTIHCGEESKGIETAWKDGALLAEGKYMFIDHNKAVVHFKAPQDQTIAELGAQLNATYIAFGKAGEASANRQAVQDANSLVLANEGAAVQRALCKASSNYRNPGWDLVDACKEGTVKLSEIAEADLPAALKALTPAERAEHLRKTAEERTRIQNRIQELNQDRNRFIAEQRRTSAPEPADTLDQVMISAIRDQAARRNYQFE